MRFPRSRTLPRNDKWGDSPSFLRPLLLFAVVLNRVYCALSDGPARLGWKRRLTALAFLQRRKPPVDFRDLPLITRDGAFL